MTKTFFALLAASASILAPSVGAAQSSKGATISQDVADCFVAGTCDFHVPTKAELADVCTTTGKCAVGKEKLVVLVKPRSAGSSRAPSANLARASSRPAATASRPSNAMKVVPKSCISAAPDALNMCLGFALGSAELTPSAMEQAQVFAAALKRNPGSGNFRIEGHTDSSGTVEQNAVLSRRRAESVVAYLVSQGVPAARLTAEGYGFSKPKPGLRASNPLNRRVEIVRN